MGLTTDPNDPALGRGVQDEPGQMNEKYLVLSEAERAKGYKRPFRSRYLHLGRGVDGRRAARDLERDGGPEDPAGVMELVRANTTAASVACGTSTWMNEAIAGTYARDPGFYGATWCAGCSMHRPLSEFLWLEEGADRVLPMVVGT